MKLRSILVLALVLLCAPVLAQVNQGTSPLTVKKGGTGIASGTSGGVTCFSTATQMASSVALTASAIMLGGGAGNCPTPLGSLGTTTTVLHGNASGAPSFGAVSLTTDVSGALPFSSMPAGSSDTVLGYWGSTVISATAVNNCTGALTYSTTTHTFGCNAGAGTGTVTSVTCGTGLSGGTFTTTGTCAISGSPVLLNTLTASNSATLSDTTSLTATYPAYEIVFENLIPATNAVTAELQVHSGGSFQATGYLTTAFLPSGTAIVLDQPTTFVPISHTTSQINSAPGVSGYLRITNPSANALHGLFGNSVYVQSGPLPIPYTIGGYWNTSAVVDGFQFLFSSGNITSGVIKVYGIP